MHFETKFILILNNLEQEVSFKYYLDGVQTSGSDS